MAEDKGRIIIDAARIKALIRYHKAGLSDYRMQMSPSAQRLEEETIAALNALLKVADS